MGAQVRVGGMGSMGGGMGVMGDAGGAQMGKALGIWGGMGGYGRRGWSTGYKEGMEHTASCLLGNLVNLPAGIREVSDE